MPYSAIFFMIDVFLRKMAPIIDGLSWSSQPADRLPVQWGLACDTVQFHVRRRPHGGHLPCAWHDRAEA